MDQMFTVLLITALVAAVTGILIPMLSGAATPERKAERDAALSDQVSASR
jgi:hypothetical protein